MHLLSCLAGLPEVDECTPAVLWQSTVTCGIVRCTENWVRIIEKNSTRFNIQLSRRKAQIKVLKKKHKKLPHPSALPDLEIFEALCIDLVDKEVRQLLAKLVEAVKKTLYVAELKLGLLTAGIFPVFPLLHWREGHELLQRVREGGFVGEETEEGGQ